MSIDPVDGSSAVVVPAIDAPSSVACARSLGKRGIHTVVVSEDEGAAAFSSRYAGEAVVVPDPHEDLVAYKDALRSLAMRPDVLTILPVREEDVYVLARYREEFEPHVETLWPTLDGLRQVQDRVELFDAAERAGVAVPETRVLDDVDDWDREWIVKGRYTLLADAYLDDYPPEKSRDPPSTQYLNGDRPDVETIRRANGHTPIVQEFLPTTDEYGFFALYDEGTPVSTFQHRQIRAYNYAGGPSAYRESVSIPELGAAGRALLDELDWHGLAMVEFLRNDDTGEFELMEINPRLWSSLPFSVRAGADFPYHYWQLASGERDSVDDDYEVGIAGHLLRGELSYLHSVLLDEEQLVERPDRREAFTDVVRSLRDHPRFDYLRLDDPKPFVRDALNTLT
ncbi:carboxylate--amine ligase [Halosimplex salinum]|uniref:carboxylate--amine ligase n=1 Tax=Halosimplex salinum TaxID=1710538 RepID=UPI000F46435C|nr:carboxylate--amine ligase [Halosimplex salinum]